MIVLVGFIVISMYLSVLEAAELHVVHPDAVAGRRDAVESVANAAQHAARRPRAHGEPLRRTTNRSNTLQNVTMST